MSRALLRTGDYSTAQADLVADAVDAHIVRLVAHSGAGPILPVIAEQLLCRGVAVSNSVFVDAGLPHPGRSRFEVLPKAAVAHLRSMAVDDRLTPWPLWWSPEELALMVPDVELRTELIADCPQLPLGLFTEPMPDGDHVAMGKLGFCRLSDAYDTAAEHAARNGWDVVRLARQHLSPMTDPEPIADAIDQLAAR